jgi:hypothetical protein
VQCINFRDVYFCSRVFPAAAKSRDVEKQAIVRLLTRTAVDYRKPQDSWRQDRICFETDGSHQSISDHAAFWLSLRNPGIRTNGTEARGVSALALQDINSAA